MASESLEKHKNHPTLAEEIQLATRSVHAKLNKLIIDRLPLALPPIASSPSIYLSGLLHIAPIYITFEALWAQIIDVGNEGSADKGLYAKKVHFQNQDPAVQCEPGVDERIREVLRRLRLPGLMRSSLLKADVQSLTGWSEHDVESQLKTVSKSGRLGEFVSHIKRVIDRKPHVILAYSYIMFMALFAGGRILRASLAAAGADFWEQVAVAPQCAGSQSHGGRRVREDQPLHKSRTCSQEPHVMPLLFFSFQTPREGEDLKHAFKSHLQKSEEVLTEKERHDIVQEAVCIFDNMSLLVHQLDVVCLKQAFGQANPGERADDNANSLNYPVSTRLRESVFVAHGRHARRSSKHFSASEDDICTVVQAKTSINARGGINTAPPARNPAVIVPGFTGVELCPSFSKSMRFEKPFVRTSQAENISMLSARHPLADPGEARAESTTSYEEASARICGVHIRNWLIMAAFGVIVLGALVTGRTGMASHIVVRLPCNSVLTR